MTRVLSYAPLHALSHVPGAAVCVHGRPPMKISPEEMIPEKMIPGKMIPGKMIPGKMIPGKIIWRWIFPRTRFAAIARR
ncbi:MAG: hypothetical protein ACNI3A_15610 [Desulfovibrio sp.]|uniref:hypothetical protein n=1 Tax=Desulfovibrio sp. 7SRBS1 TaxID=3378064 RepID=UPI003B3C65F6